MTLTQEQGVNLLSSELNKNYFKSISYDLYNDKRYFQGDVYKEIWAGWISWWVDGLS